jgi:hypothetical protein
MHLHTVLALHGVATGSPQEFSVLQDFDWDSGVVPEHLQSAAGLVQGLKDGDVDAFRALSYVVQDIQLDDDHSCELMHLLVPHVLREYAELQPAPSQQQQQLQSIDEGAITAGTASSDSNEWWCAAVDALAAVWGDHCIKLGPDMVLWVLQRVLQGLLQLQQQEPKGVDSETHHMDLDSLSELWREAAILLMGVRAAQRPGNSSGAAQQHHTPVGSSTGFQVELRLCYDYSGCAAGGSQSTAPAGAACCTCCCVSAAVQW